MYHKNVHEIRVLLGISLMHYHGKGKMNLRENYYLEYYDPTLEENNKRLYMAVIPEWGNNLVISPSLGMEYRSKIKSVPFYFQLQAFANANVLNDNREYVNFISLNDGVIPGRIGIKNEVYHKFNIRFNLGIGLFQFRKS